MYRTAVIGFKRKIELIIILLLLLLLLLLLIVVVVVVVVVVEEVLRYAVAHLFEALR